MQENLFAFWAYDKYPYYLWGKIIAFTDRGLASVENYAGYVKPVLILPEEDAKEFILGLENLKQDRHMEIQNIEKRYGDLRSTYVYNFLGRHV